MLLLLPLALQTATVSAAPQPTPLNDPVEWFAVYPAAALRGGEEGRVAFEVAVDAKGAITGCKIVESSNSAVLDAATCDGMRANARFAPAKDAGGRAVASSFRRGMRWRLPELVPVPVTSFASIARLDIAADGKLVSCRADAKGTVPVTAVGEACDLFGPAATARYLDLKGDLRGVRALVTHETALTIDSDIAFPEEYRRSGRKLAGLVRVRFDITPEGRVGNCRQVERGGTLTMPPLCPEPIGPFEIASGANTGRSRGAMMLVAYSYQPQP